MTTPDQSYAQGYRNLIYEQAQQKGSKLRGAVRVESRQFNVDFFERIGPSDVTEKTSRFADSPTTDVPHSRRMLTYKDYQHYPFLDSQEAQRLLIDPRSKYVKSGIQSMGRKMDDVIITAAFGTAYEGQDGSTSTTFPASQDIAHGSADLTFDKLREAKALLLNNDVDLEMTNAHIACTGTQLSSLLDEAEVKSSDYNSVKALVDGTLSYFMGFNFHIVSPSLLPVATNIREVLCWAEDGILLSVGASSARTVIRDDKSGAWQMQYDMSFGATRMEEEKVIRIYCDES